MLILTPEIRAKLAEKLKARLIERLGPDKFAKLEAALKSKKAGGN